MIRLGGVDLLLHTIYNAYTQCNESHDIIKEYHTKQREPLYSSELKGV